MSSQPTTSHHVTSSTDPAPTQSSQAAASATTAGTQTATGQNNVQLPTQQVIEGQDGEPVHKIQLIGHIKGVPGRGVPGHTYN